MLNESIVSNMSVIVKPVEIIAYTNTRVSVLKIEGDGINTAQIHVLCIKFQDIETIPIVSKFSGKLPSRRLAV